MDNFRCWNFKAHLGFLYTCVSKNIQLNLADLFTTAYKAFCDGPSLSPSIPPGHSCAPVIENHVGSSSTHTISSLNDCCTCCPSASDTFFSCFQLILRDSDPQMPWEAIPDGLGGQPSSASSQFSLYRGWVGSQEQLPFVGYFLGVRPWGPRDSLFSQRSKRGAQGSIMAQRLLPLPPPSGPWPLGSYDTEGFFIFPALPTHRELPESRAICPSPGLPRALAYNRGSINICRMHVLWYFGLLLWFHCYETFRFSIFSSNLYFPKATTCCTQHLNFGCK